MQIDSIISSVFDYYNQSVGNNFTVDLETDVKIFMRANQNLSVQVFGTLLNRTLTTIFSQYLWTILVVGGES